MSKKMPLLAKADSLRAIQFPGQVTIYAAGQKPTPQTRVWLEGNLLTVFPPEYLLRLQQPTAVDIQILVPFQAEVPFRAAGPVEKVVVYDSVGRHEVPVEQVTDPRIPPKPPSAGARLKQGAPKGRKRVK